MPSTGFLHRTLHHAKARAESEKRQLRPGLQRAAAMTTGLVLAATMFFVLKGLAMAAGAGMPGSAGLAFWLSGPDPLSTAFGTAFQPVFSGRS